MKHYEARGRPQGRRRRLSAVGLLALIAALGICAVPAGAEAAKKRQKPKPVKVMTRNLYLGAELTPAFTPVTPDEFVGAVGDVWNQVVATRWSDRAQALAEEILSRKPDLVGLQEVTMWRTQFPPDGAPPPFGTGTAATEVTYDFLSELMFRLNEDANNYRVVNVNTLFDFESAADKGPPNDGSFGGMFPPCYPCTRGADLDVRLTDRDVILAKVGRRIKTRFSANGVYSNLATLNLLGGAIQFDIKRGWQYAQARVRGKAFRFVNTHLEAFDGLEPGVREKQAEELVAGPASRAKRTILVGDLNSDDNTVPAGEERDAFLELVNAGFVERDNQSFTCCWNASLTGGVRSSHIDHVMTNRPRLIKRKRAVVTGKFKVFGLYPSDHLGEHVKLFFKKKKQRRKRRR